MQKIRQSAYRHNEETIVFAQSSLNNFWDIADDSGKAAAAGEVELGGFMKADANPVGDGSRHGGVLREAVV